MCSTLGITRSYEKYVHWHNSSFKELTPLHHYILCFKGAKVRKTFAYSLLYMNIFIFFNALELVTVQRI